MIFLTCAKIPVAFDKNTLARAVSLMFPNPKSLEYIENIRSRANDASASESLFALSLLYEQIRSFPINVDMNELEFTRHEKGKPYFKNSDIKFNVSHSEGFVACASSVGEEVGVDAEAKKLPCDRAIKMAEKYFNQKEIEAIKEHPESFSAIWSEKEARSKFSGNYLGETLEHEKKACEDRFEGDIRVHRFAVDDVPVTLCTKRNFSTIIFSVQ